MNEEQKSQLIAEAENIEAIRDFFVEWWSVEELYETLAKASVTVLHFCNRVEISSDERKDLEDFMYQYMMMLEHLKPFAERKEGEV